MKTCLITGVTRGLGQELAIQYKSAGYRVVGVARTKKHLKDCRDKGILDDHFSCDLSKRQDVDSLITYIESRYDCIDDLVLNAGVQNQYEIFNSSSYFSQVENEFKINFLANVQLVNGLLGIVLNSKSVIIGISSLLSVVPKRSAPGYCASKAAFSSWLKNLRSQLETSGVKVIEVIPGLIKTSMTKEGEEKGVAPQKLAEYIFERASNNQIVLPGAKLGWMLYRICPAILEIVLGKK